MLGIEGWKNGCGFRLLVSGNPQKEVVMDEKKLFRDTFIKSREPLPIDYCSSTARRFHILLLSPIRNYCQSDSGAFIHQKIF